MLYGRLEEEERDKYLYHYTTPSKFASILDSGEIWLTQYEKTKDPREYGRWEWNVQHAASVKFEKDVRRSIKLACFARDNPHAEYNSPDFFFLYRGWARARMWSQYADDQSGACLIFDRSLLTRAMASHADARGLPTYKGNVTYEDSRIPTGALTYPSVESQSNLIEAERRLIAERWEQLFLRKTGDWATENEYRYLMVSDEDVEKVKYGNALVGIVIGPDFPASELSVIAHRLNSLHLPHVQVKSLGWVEGVPYTAVEDGVPPSNATESRTLPPAELGAA